MEVMQLVCRVPRLKGAECIHLTERAEEREKGSEDCKPSSRSAVREVVKPFLGRIVFKRGAVILHYGAIRRGTFRSRKRHRGEGGERREGVGAGQRVVETATVLDLGHGERSSSGG